MKFMHFSIKYRYIIYMRLFCCNHTCYCVGMVSVTSASRYVTLASRYQIRSLMYIRGPIPRNSTDLAEAVPIGHNHKLPRERHTKIQTKRTHKNPSNHRFLPKRDDCQARIKTKNYTTKRHFSCSPEQSMKCILLTNVGILMFISRIHI